jgi:hypothetical protein
VVILLGEGPATFKTIRCPRNLQHQPQHPNLILSLSHVVYDCHIKYPLI